ncbi:hypothetical protein GCM10014715_22530 [Streptomyces spiralis]|uniref:Uncharacterized protein n=1 Tax=Streptomyces spiralis TaxID=66376 RepID=A0A919DR09_9ACTN|nr:hypothetical protein GCM10014715_22530 [Streptomyces spiralis]
MAGSATVVIAPSAMAMKVTLTHITGTTRRWLRREEKEEGRGRAGSAKRRGDTC